MKQYESPSSPLSPDREVSDTRRRVTPRQSNHESYVLPTCLEHLPPMPLYLAVAHFGLLSGQPLSRAMICQAFHLDTRRALEIMRYLSDGAPRVTCERLSLMQGRGYCLRILAIADPAQTGAGSADEHVTARRHDSAARCERARQQQLRQWFLRRPNP
ncbi:CaiF/GrlA family transcriptional regulator [Serratia sp. SRS-8-S-2018]|uniref:CaiF/GrlA family transcriptional regulator n=1 Tax=Serratia sp. SRS-8-S-2018 TaxID=2591107 RepID=UPI0015E84A24|nr:CaiF/GrlA family transcriptional regulator [Serratia sp. SRS-8-S-2018]